MEDPRATRFVTGRPRRIPFWGSRRSFVQNGEIELTETLGISEDVDLDYPSARDYEAQHGQRMTAFVEHHNAGRAIDQCRPREAATRREQERLLGHLGRTANDP